MPTLDDLPRFDACDLTILCRIEYWDGPITGLIRRGTDLFWFDWTHNDDPEAETSPPRIFNLHLIPAGMVPIAQAWAQRNDELHDEFGLIANPHIRPMSVRQRATLRPSTEVEADWETHAQLRPHWEDLPVTAWFSEVGSDAFAAFQTFNLDPQRAKDFKQWQQDVARALAAEDQPALDHLFTDPPVPGEPLDIYFVLRPEPSEPTEPDDFACVASSFPSNGPLRGCIVRDWRGQPLSEDFLMTARHRVQCFDGLIHQDDPSNGNRMIEETE